MSTTEEQLRDEIDKILWEVWRNGKWWVLPILNENGEVMPADKLPRFGMDVQEANEAMYSLLSQHTQRAKIIEISTRDTCDYCKEPMKYAGSNDGVKVVRSCAKHLELAKNRLAQLSTKDLTNKEEA